MLNLNNALKYREISTQTEKSQPLDFNCTLQSINKMLVQFCKQKFIDLLKKLILNKYPRSLLLQMLPDLVEYLISGVRPKPWSHLTLFYCVRAKIRAGNSLFQHFRNFFHFPLPSVRTLNRFVENFPCTPGIQHQHLARLKSQFSYYNYFEKHLVLILDEMNLDPKVSYNRQLKQIFGLPSILPSTPKNGYPKPIERASHLLVVLARGYCSTIKIIVGWHLTGSCTDRKAVKGFILDCIKQLTLLGGIVLNISGDMGIMNQALFSDCGMKCQRVYQFKSEKNNLMRQCLFRFCISMNNPITDHPIYFIHDPMHLCKTLRNTLLKYEIFVSDEILEFFNIESHHNIISFQWIREFARIQSEKLYPLVELREFHLNPYSYQKMNVGIARRVLSREVAAGIIDLIDKNLLPESARTTAIFIGLFADWFKIISNRSVKNAVHLNHVDENKASLDRVMLFANFFSQCNVLDPKRHNCWTQVQRGILVTSHSFDKLCNQLIEKCFKFVLAAPFTSDAIESFFGYMRFLTGPHADANKVFRVLRCLLVSDLLNSHCNMDLSDNNVCINNKLPTEVCIENYFTFSTNQMPTPGSIFPNQESESLYYLSGAIVHYILKSCNLCTNCKYLLEPREWSTISPKIFDCLTKKNIETKLYFNHFVEPELENDAKFTRLASRGGLIFVSKTVFQFICFIDSIIREQLTNYIQTPKIFDALYNLILNDSQLPKLPTCCSLSSLLVRRCVLILTQRILHKLFNSDSKPKLYIKCQESQSQPLKTTLTLNVPVLRATQ